MRIILVTLLILAMRSVVAQDTEKCRQVAIGNCNALAFKFLESGYNKSSNIAVSSISIFSVNTMLAYGAVGLTRDELLSIQKTPNDISCMGSGVQSMLKASQFEGEGIRFNIVNAAWFNKDIPIKQEFRSTLKNDLDANVRNINFDNGEAATDTINQYFSDKTQGRIPKIFEEPLPGGTEWVIGNACYFKGDWKTPFKVSDTKIKTFTTALGKTVQAAFMHNTDMYRYFPGEGFELLAIPYVGDRFSFVICMPSFRTASVSSMLQNMDETKLFKTLSSAGRTQIALDLPKFTMRERYDLIGTYQQWGISKPFTDGDFSNIWVNSSDITEFYHGIFIQVDEKGTEAAAVTGAAGYRSMPDSFIVDKPFFFAIVDEVNQTILFAGIINDPLLSKP